MDKQGNKIDMLHGTIVDKLLLFALPLAATSILQQLFNSADVAVVGRFAGSQAQAAVGVNNSVISLLINLFVGLSVGANVVIANYIGREKTKEVHDVVHTVIPLALMSGFFLLAVGMIAARPMLRIIDTPSDIIDMAVVYLRIYFGGMPFLMLYNYGSAILRSVGDTKRPLYCLVISGALNVCLNLLLVIVFKLGVVGVGIATVFSNGVSAGLIFRFLMREESAIKVNVRELKLNVRHLVKVIKIGIPAGIQGMVFSLSNLCVQSAINSFGSGAIAGSSSAVNFEFFTYFITSAFGQAAVTFTSQNYGVGQFDRCKKIYRYSMLLGIVLTGVMCAGFVLLRNYAIRFYTVDDEAIYYALIRVMHVELFAFLPVTYEISGATLRGMGHSMLPAVLTVIGSCGLRFGWVYTVFRRFNSFEMLMNVYPVTWIVTGTIVIAAYLIIRHKLFKSIEERGESFAVQNEL